MIATQTFARTATRKKERYKQVKLPQTAMNTIAYRQMKRKKMWVISLLELISKLVCMMMVIRVDSAQSFHDGLIHISGDG